MRPHFPLLSPPIPARRPRDFGSSHHDVPPAVKGQVVGAGEAAVAVRAVEGLDARVLAEVPGQLVGAGELPGAAFPGAFVGLLACTRGAERGQHRKKLPPRALEKEKKGGVSLLQRVRRGNPSASLRYLTRPGAHPARSVGATGCTSAAFRRSAAPRPRRQQHPRRYFGVFTHPCPLQHCPVTPRGTAKGTPRGSLRHPHAWVERGALRLWHPPTGSVQL